MAVNLSVDPPVKIGPVADFDLKGLRKHLYAKGVDVTWEQAAVCPCGVLQGSNMGLPVTSTVNTKMRRTDCENCEGRGYYYHSPLPIRVLMVGYRSNPELFSQIGGEYAKGYASFTAQPEHLIGFLDRFTLTNSVCVFREPRTRTSATVERPKYPIVTRSLLLTAGLTDVNVLDAIKAQATGLVDPADKLVPGVDFEITPAGAIDWTLGDLSGKAPAVGSRYSLSYYIHPRFVVQDNPHVARDTHLQKKTPTREHRALVVQAMARLEWLGDGDGTVF
jgi:hypothetical protein